MVEEPTNNIERKTQVLSTKDQFDKLEATYHERLPKKWEEFNMTQKLDWFTHRMLLDKREIIRLEQGNDAARDWGFLSDYQLERRRRREMHSKLNGWEDIPPRQGVFGRVHVDKNVLLIGRTKEDGPKNP